MRSLTWDRAEVIGRVRRDIWRHLTASARTDDEVLLEAAALLQMRAGEVRTLAQLQYVLSDEVAELLARMPVLVRRLTTTTRRETETSASRVRGPVVWPETFAARAVTGLPHLYVTAPARRAFDTPENQLLRYCLSTIREAGRRTGWDRAAGTGVGDEIRARVNEATRWLAVRSLAGIQLRPISAETLSRVRTSRRRRDYQAALSTFMLHQRYLKRLDRDAVRNAVERQALVTSQDSTLLELLCAFAIVRALRRLGWEGAPVALLAPPRLFQGRRGDSSIEVYYQHTPRALSAGSIYREMQKAHAFETTSGLIPDLVLRVEREPDQVRWVLVEVKGLERAVQQSARAALSDLLAYRRAFASTLTRQSGPYGIGIAWGEDLRPTSTDEIVLCTPDTIQQALELAT